MTYFADLSPCDYFDPSWTDCLCAIGWLEAGHDYNRGTPSSQFVEKLTALLEDPWQPEASFGWYLCDFCVPETEGKLLGPAPASLRSMARGGNNVFVPDDTLLYVAPSLVKHYIEAHGYRPPEEFCAAVMRCPDMWSDEYFNALEATDWCKVAEQQLKVEGQSWMEYVKEEQQIHGFTPEEFHKFIATMNDDAQSKP